MHGRGEWFRRVGFAALFVCVSLLGESGAIAAEPAAWTLKSALKQIDKATKGFRGIRGEAEYIGGQGATAINGTGTLYVSHDGRARFDLPGDEPQTVFWLYAYLLVHDPTMNTVTSVNLLINPQTLAQYALLGFVPTGNGLKKKYDVKLVGEETLNGKPALMFVLSPKSKEVAKSISLIRLWIDQRSWFPAKQEVLLAGSKSKLSVHYRDLVRDDDLPDSLFRPAIPVGTEQIKR